MTPTNITDQLMRDEGVRLKPYTDSVGKLTIGIGRNLTDVGLTTTEAEYLLENDIQKAIGSLRVAMPWTAGLDPVRHAALVNMTFNMGIGGLLQFKLAMVAMQNGNWQEAQTQILTSKWATQVGARAYRLAKQILTGEWQ